MTKNLYAHDYGPVHSAGASHAAMPILKMWKSATAILGVSAGVGAVIAFHDPMPSPAYAAALDKLPPVGSPVPGTAPYMPMITDDDGSEKNALEDPARPDEASAQLKSDAPAPYDMPAIDAPLAPPAAAPAVPNAILPPTIPAPLPESTDLVSTPPITPVDPVTPDTPPGVTPPGPGLLVPPTPPAPPLDPPGANDPISDPDTAAPPASDAFIPAPLPVASDPPPPQPVITPGGAYLVQIMATPHEDSICAIWLELKTASPDLFAYAEKSVSRLDQPDGSVLFRLRAGAFADRAQADLFCDRLKAKGHQCYSVQRPSV